MSSTTLGLPPCRPRSRADAWPSRELLPNVLALGLGHAGEEREQGGAVSGRVVDALEGAGEEFEFDVVVAQVLGDGQEFGGAASEALHLVHGEDHPLVRDSLLDGAGEVHRLYELGPHLDGC